MLRFLLSLIAGGAAYYGFLFVFPKFILAALVGLVAFIIAMRALKLVFNRSGKDDDGKDLSAGRKAEKAADDGVRALTRIRNQSRLVADNEVARKIQEICKIGVDIFDYVKKNPLDLKKINTFKLYYLDSTEKIISQYVELARRKDRSAEMDRAVEKAAGVLDQVKATFEKQLAGLYEDDVLNLDVEIDVLKKTMTHEG